MTKTSDIFTTIPLIADDTVVYAYAFAGISDGKNAYLRCVAGGFEGYISIPLSALKLDNKIQLNWLVERYEFKTADTVGLDDESIVKNPAMSNLLKSKIDEAVASYNFCTTPRRVAATVN